MALALHLDWYYCCK